VTRAFPIRAATAVTMLCASLGIVVGLAIATTPAKAAPTCPAGTTFDAGTGNCTAPATAACPAGFTQAGTTCTKPACPAGSFAVDPSVGAPEPGCFDPILGFTGISDPLFAAICPVGTTFTFPNPMLGANPGTCEQPVTFSCAAGTLAGALCIFPANLTAPCAGVVFQGQCFLPGSTGPADASGGNAGSARGGDGGRGGSGTGATCNQSTNDTIWDFADEPSVDCAEGGTGGEAGDGGISEGGDGGFAFTDGLF
jgi:hypothetical protein